jgi:hypothetical protein
MKSMLAGVYLHWRSSFTHVVEFLLLFYLLYIFYCFLDCPPFVNRSSIISFTILILPLMTTHS